MSLEDYKGWKQVTSHLLNELCPIPSPTEQDYINAANSFFEEKLDTVDGLGFAPDSVPVDIIWDRVRSFTNPLELIDYLGDWALVPNNDDTWQLQSYIRIRHFNINGLVVYELYTSDTS